MAFYTHTKEDVWAAITSKQDDAFTPYYDSLVITYKRFVHQLRTTHYYKLIQEDFESDTILKVWKQLRNLAKRDRNFSSIRDLNAYAFEALKGYLFKLINKDRKRLAPIVDVNVENLEDFDAQVKLRKLEVFDVDLSGLDLDKIYMIPYEGTKVPVALSNIIDELKKENQQLVEVYYWFFVKEKTAKEVSEKMEVPLRTLDRRIKKIKITIKNIVENKHNVNKSNNIEEKI